MSKDKKSKQKIKISYEEEEKMYKSFGSGFPYEYDSDKPLNIKTIEKIIDFFENYQINDIFDGPHMLEDSIMTIFISQLAENMYKKSEITKLAKAIERLNEAVSKIGRYYA
jgi:hypothetical protein